ncbi:HIT domain-containing protein [Ferrimonas sp. YFM]|uniref:HIT domain-containing protein n=1 Tax=Ferrimonas sp. YFM TaxID=3028878 RepID=UPI002573B5B3|nr:HIT domain-containing protein [Ferrimonas sp. YFM]BDY03523.1 histidine triad protein [Ferrimonas sp. YFM]
MFELHERLEQDSMLIGHLSLCQVRLSKDGRYPWLILIPERSGIKEIHHLSDDDQQQMMRESCQVAQIMEEVLSPDKVNVASLGNMVPQLHLHHVARFASDDAWPGPIWGAHPALLESEHELEQKSHQWQQWLSRIQGFVVA